MPGEKVRSRSKLFSWAAMKSLPNHVNVGCDSKAMEPQLSVQLAKGLLVGPFGVKVSQVYTSVFWNQIDAGRVLIWHQMGVLAPSCYCACWHKGGFFMLKLQHGDILMVGANPRLDVVS
ncbi:unnamed protein product [Amaranthus hypochondriacus]